VTDVELQASIPDSVTWDQWQPIETAPKDGTNILVSMWDTCVMLVVFYDGLRMEFPWIALDGSSSYHHNAPTHWMPLPEVPR
jgi:hypothetical protein